MAKEIKEYFTCGKCGSKDFYTRYSFAIVLRKVNFSDAPMYDRVTEKCYECRGCGNCIDKSHIKSRIREIKRKHKLSM